MLATFKIILRNRYLARRLQWSFVSERTKGRHFSFVADIGCGRSPYKKLISHDSFVSMDKHNPSDIGGFVAADIAERLPLEDASVDLVLLTEVLEHMPNPENLLKEIFRILKPGGELILTTPFVWEVHEAPYDFFRYTRFGIQTLLRSGGFGDITVTETNGFLYSLLQLMVMRMNHFLFIPVVVVCNVLGYVLFKFERTSGFPLSVHASARKA